MQGKHVFQKWEPVLGQDVHGNKILERIPKSVKRFSDKMRVDDGLCANEQC
jgi:hypothetical protein